ncbi:hypothetical protein FHX73_114250 [Kitasatospora viridis]|uniref:Uncharacterized protein n=1 Tax=Kitasatospora viridis TaxID=281105 RepID=A0A561ULZ2_9ACTN|nr:hypothetical protein FHX73_114250 [Kitasatospora viridis]
MVSDASPAYGHPAVPEELVRVEPAGYGYQGHSSFNYPYPAPEQPQLPPQLPPPGPPPLAPPLPPPGRRPGLLAAVLVGTLALVVLAGGLVTVALQGSSSRAPAMGAPAPAASPPVGAAPAPSQPPTAAPTPAPTPTTPLPGTPDTQPPAAGSAVQDQVHGWTVPVPAGWDTAYHDANTTVLLVTGQYPCANQGGCVRGNFSIDARPTAGPDAETVARQTMALYAPQLFGTLDDHQELSSGPTAVAGLAGFAVRWHVTPQQGAQGFLLLVAVPAPSGGFTTMVASADDDPRAPRPGALDDLVAAIQPAGRASLPPNAS